MVSPILVRPGGKERKGPLLRYERPVSLALYAVAALFVGGTLLDLGVLWIAQRQTGAQWEFVAISSTVEAIPRLALGVGMAYVALYVSQSASTLAYRGLALALVLVGVFGAALGALMLTVYFPIARIVQPESVQLFRSTVIKAVGLSALYTIALVPIGIHGLRGPKS